MKHFGSEKGATMVEIIMILGILGALSVSIATLVNSMYDRYRVSRVCGQIEEFKNSLTTAISPTGVTAMFPLQPSLRRGLRPRTWSAAKSCIIPITAK